MRHAGWASRPTTALRLRLRCDPPWVSRSALGQTIRALEERLGACLLNRTTRSVAPSDAAARLLARVVPALDELEAAQVERSARASPSDVRGSNAPRIPAMYLIAPRLGACQRAYPDIQLAIVVHNANTPKGRTRRTVPMTETLHAALKRMSTIREGFVVRNLDGTAKTDKQAVWVLARLCRLAGLPERQWHVYRPRMQLLVTVMLLGATCAACGDDAGSATGDGPPSGELIMDEHDFAGSIYSGFQDTSDGHPAPSYSAGRDINGTITPEFDFAAGETFTITMDAKYGGRPEQVVKPDLLVARLLLADGEPVMRIAWVRNTSDGSPTPDAPSGSSYSFGCGGYDSTTQTEPTAYDGTYSAFRLDVTDSTVTCSHGADVLMTTRTPKPIGHNGMGLFVDTSTLAGTSWISIDNLRFYRAP